MASTTDDIGDETGGADGPGEGAILSELLPLFDRVRKASRDDPFPKVEIRRDRIDRLVAMTEAAETRIADAIDQDFGGRSRIETRLAETGYIVAAGAHARRRLAGWMKTRSAPTALHFRPLSNSVLPQPLGVVGVLSPWNYPYHLAIAPLIGAFAAGNRAMLKPSELTPATAELISELVAERFSSEELLVVEGGPEVAAAFARLPFDHLLFTGSSETGAEVARAAARNHVPVTLELGGKSPAIIDASANLDHAAAQIAWGKWFNAGQTCVAPDYVLVPDTMLEGFVERLGKRLRRSYPAGRIGRDYTAIISDRHYQRLTAMLREAEDYGAEVIRPLGPDQGRRMMPAIVTGAAEHTRLRREEIFGPILPVVPCPDVDVALARIGELPRPLALYWFGTDRLAEIQLARESCSGGLTVNACMVQLAQEDLPFGGVGASGQGHYHGQWGFDRFSNLKPVTRRGRGFDTTRVFHPPYGPTTRSAIELFRRVVKFRS